MYRPMCLIVLEHSHDSETRITVYFFEMSLQKNVKSHFLDFQNKRRKRSRTMAEADRANH